MIKILGAGLSGLLAAKALEDLNIDFKIIAEDYGDSHSCGLHYLHENCNLELKLIRICNYIEGIQENSSLSLEMQYARKVTGNEANSVSNLEPISFGYSCSEAMAKLMQNFKIDCRTELQPEQIKRVLNKGDTIISTIPLPILFPVFNFESQIRFVSPERPEELEQIKYPAHSVVYNLNPNINWYRYSYVDGKHFTERIKKEEDRDIMIKKIITKNFTFSHPNLILAGRCGEWNKKRLAHQVYYNIYGQFKKNSIPTS